LVLSKPKITNKILKVINCQSKIAFNWLIKDCHYCKKEKNEDVIKKGSQKKKMFTLLVSSVSICTLICPQAENSHFKLNKANCAVLMYL